MDAQIYALIVCGAFVTNLFVEFIGWKMWKHALSQNSNFNGNRSALKIMLFFDPLVSAVVFPMASDLYWSFDWASSCGLTIVCVLVSILLLLYFSTLLISYNLVFTFVPLSQDARLSCKKMKLFCSGLSIIINILLTWLILVFTTRYSSVFDAAEECWQRYLYKNVYYIFEVTFTFQFVTFYLYVHFGLCIIRKCKVIPMTVNNGEESTSASRRHSILMCGAASIVILFLSNVFRSLFSSCSCYSYSRISPIIFESYFLFQIKATFISTAWLCSCLLKKVLLRGCPRF